MEYKKQEKKFCIGLTKNKEIVFVEIEIGSCDNNHYTITHNTYENIITETKGEEEARETLSQCDYWEGLGYLNEIPHILKSNIDFEQVAEEVLNSDGWTNTNGEYYEIGEYKGENYFINFSSCGCSIDDLKKEYEKLLITKEEKEILIKSDKLHLKDFKNYTKEEKIFFEIKVLPLFEKFENQKLTAVKDLIPFLLEVE